MRQEVYRDQRTLDDYRDEPSGRVLVRLVAPPRWRRITGEAAPPSPVDRASYAAAGLTWPDDCDDPDDPSAGGMRVSGGPW